MTRAGAVIHYTAVEPERTDGCATHRVHADADGSGLELCMVVVPAAATTRRDVASGREDVLFVVAGTGTLTIDEDAHALGPDTGALVGSGTDYRLRADQTPLEVVVVTGDADPNVSCGAGSPIVDLDEQERQSAVSQREFQVLIDPGRGCSGMTQFVGYVPRVRTPRHVHPYDEMLCILRGSGTVEIEGRAVEVGPGDCYYLPRGCVHLVQNTRDEPLVELGVFTPAGSPAQNTPVE